jgi:hypothetical protein
MIEKINLTGPADLLATIPHLLGITPSESFVVLTAQAGALARPCGWTPPNTSSRATTRRR